jgi:2-methylcitrate dehydratase
VPFLIHRCAIEPYPAVIYTQTAIVAGNDVAREVGSLDRIVAIEIATTQRGYQRTGSEAEKWSPKTRETADHSLPYITARAMFDGDITNESFKLTCLAIHAFSPSCKRSRSARTPISRRGSEPRPRA